MTDPTHQGAIMTEHAVTRRKLPGIASLRTILRIDAITCLAMGLALTAFAGALGGLLGLPTRLLVVAGLVLLPCAALMHVATHGSRPSRALAWLVIAGNIAWVIASIGVAAMLAPNMLGVAFLLAQAAVVALLASLEYRELRALA